MTDLDVRRAIMLRQRALQLTAAAGLEPARRTHLLSLAETYRTAADELAPGTSDQAAEFAYAQSARQI